MKHIRKSGSNIILAVGIVWIMMSLFNFNCYAENAFQKKKVEGVMATAVDQSVVVTWEPLSGAAGYEVYEKTPVVGEYALVSSKADCKVVLEQRERGTTYQYYVRAYTTDNSGNTVNSSVSAVVSTTVAVTGTSTVKNFLQTAIAPIGSTMYVWGGGWNKADTAAGKEAKQTGLAASWRTFAKNKKSSYNYRNYRYQIHNGLDCSGYVGWCVYNVRNTQNGKKGYVYSASKQAKKFAAMGFGSYQTAKEVTDYQAGDIMSSTCKCCGHVWIVIGECEDGSVVLVHSSPAGVQLSGTTTPSGKKNSEAFQLAKKYMKKYYPKWYAKYPNVSRGATYLSHYAQMRWETEGGVLSDPDGYQQMSAQEVLKDLFGE